MAYNSCVNSPLRNFNGPYSKPPQKEVNLIQERIENLAIQSIAAWVKTQVYGLSRIFIKIYGEGDDTDDNFRVFEQHLKEIREYLERGVFKAAFNDVAKEIIRVLGRVAGDLLFNEYCVPKDLFCHPISISYSSARMVEVVFSQKLTCLMISNDLFCWASHMPSRNKFEKAHFLTELTVLDLKYYKQCPEQDIIQFLKKLKKLRSLALPKSECSIDIMNCISQIELIEELDLAGSKLNDAKINWITQLRNLRIININNTYVTDMGYKTLLLSCKHLEYVEGCHLVDVLKLIVADPEYKGQTFGIKRFSTVCGENTLLEILRVFKMCPRLCDLETNSSFIVSNFHALTGLTNLQKIRIYFFNEDQPWDVLKKIGHNLTELSICSFPPCLDKDVLLLINSTCPNLKTLEIKISIIPNTEIAWSSSKHKSDNVSKQNIKVVNMNRPFIALKNFIFYCSTVSFIEILSIVLSNCTNIEYIEIYIERGNITGDCLLDCLHNNPMELLDTLKIRGTIKLPRIVVDQFIRKCARLQYFLVNYYNLI